MAYEKAQLNFSNLKRVKIEQIVVGLLSVRFGFRCFQHLFFFRSREFPRVVGFFLLPILRLLCFRLVSCFF